MKKIITLSFALLMVFTNGCQKSSQVTEPEPLNKSSYTASVVEPVEGKDAYTDCEGLILEPDLRGDNLVVKAGEKKQFTVEYSIIACGQNYSDLKLKGELVKKAVYMDCVPGNVSLHFKNENTFFNWNIEELSAGNKMSFSVTFEFEIPDVPYGTMIPLTGGWVVEGKSSSGDMVTTGNYNEIFVQVQ